MSTAHEKLTKAYDLITEAINQDQDIDEVGLDEALEIIEKAQKRILQKRTRTLLEEVECNTIARVLREHKGNKLEAAKRLGIGRQTLYNKIREYGI
jgi:transcriptional regulator with PAS, ATPase and Fis domain